MLDARLCFVATLLVAPGVLAQSSESQANQAPSTEMAVPTTEPRARRATDGEAAADETDIFMTADDGPMPWERSRSGPEDSGVSPLQLHWSGHLHSEIHYRVQEKSSGGFIDRQTLPQRFSRNENTLNLKLSASTGRLSGLADIDLDWLGMSEGLDNLGALSRPEQVSPVRLQAHALYFEASDVAVQGLDLRVGQQVIAWGVGDQFNPTNTVNPSDLENILYFGRQVANLMVRADYALVDMWSVTAAVVPVFKPALLPASAPLALTAVDRLPFVSQELRWRLHSERELARMLDRVRPGDEYPTVVDKITPMLPEPRVENAQWAARIAGTLLDQDIALTYYQGRTDFPVAVSNLTRMQEGEICNPDNPEDCVLGTLTTDVTLRYPRLRVVGLNLAGEINLLGWLSDVIRPIGYRLEVGLYLPSARRFTITQDAIELLGVTVDGEYDYDGDGEAGGPRPLVVEDTPFAKWVLGLDYSFGRHVYANLMWVHGLVDEYGAGDFFSEGWDVRHGGVAGRSDACVVPSPSDGERCAEEILRPRIGDYLVVGVDIRFADSKGLLRLFTIWDMQGYTFEAWDEVRDERVREHQPFFARQGLSAVISPEIEYNFGDGLVLGMGAFVQLGKDYTKFGDLAAGGSSVWARGVYAF